MPASCLVRVVLRDDVGCVALQTPKSAQDADQSATTDWLSTPYGSLWLVLHGVGVFFLVLIMELVTGWGFFKVASMLQGLRRRDGRSNGAASDRTWGTGGRGYQAVRGGTLGAGHAVHAAPPQVQRHTHTGRKVGTNS